MINMISATREATYEETIEDISMTFGRVPGFMAFMAKERLVREWPTLKNVSEIDLERASSLLCVEGLSGIA